MCRTGGTPLQQNGLDEQLRVQASLWPYKMDIILTNPVEDMQFFFNNAF